MADIAGNTSRVALSTNWLKVGDTIATAYENGFNMIFGGDTTIQILVGHSARDTAAKYIVKGSPLCCGVASLRPRCGKANAAPLRRC